MGLKLFDFITNNCKLNVEKPNFENEKILHNTHFHETVFKNKKIDISNDIKLCIFTNCEFTNIEFEQIVNEQNLILDSDFINTSITSSKLNYIDFKNVNFNKTKLNHSTFEYTDFDDCKFNDVDITNTIFKHSCFINSTFYDIGFNVCHSLPLSIIKCRILNSSFEHENMPCILKNSLFYNCNLKNTWFHNCEIIENCDFTSSKFNKSFMKNITFKNCVFESCDFGNSKFHNVRFDHCDLTNVEIDKRSITTTNCMGL